MERDHSPIGMDEIRSRLAGNLRRLRGERALSQERLALEAGIDRTMLSKIERRISNPSIETLLKLANRLSVDILTLVAPPLEPVAPASRPYRKQAAGAAVLTASEPPPAATGAYKPK